MKLDSSRFYRIISTPECAPWNFQLHIKVDGETEITRASLFSWEEFNKAAGVPGSLTNRMGYNYEIMVATPQDGDIVMRFTDKDLSIRDCLARMGYIEL